MPWTNVPTAVEYIRFRRIYSCLFFPAHFTLESCRATPSTLSAKRHERSQHVSGIVIAVKCVNGQETITENGKREISVLVHSTVKCVAHAAVSRARDKAQRDSQNKDQIRYRCDRLPRRRLSSDTPPESCPRYACTLPSSASAANPRESFESVLDNRCVTRSGN